jgi:hypothetical protein
VRDVVGKVVEQHGRIDVLHNNVGYATMGGPIELDEVAWHRTIDLNVTSCFITCKHVLPHMLQRRSGAIVNVSSVAAIRYTGYPYVAYYAAKAAVNNFIMGLALQYARQASMSGESEVDCSRPANIDMSLGVLAHARPAHPHCEMGYAGAMLRNEGLDDLRWGADREAIGGEPTQLLLGRAEVFSAPPSHL